jgi:hypothetical protein
MATPYQKLNTKEIKNDVYKIVKLRKRKTKDYNQFKYIKDETDRFLMKDDENKNGWREYFDNRRSIRRIQKSKVKETLKMMKIYKALWSDDILIEI